MSQLIRAACLALLWNVGVTPWAIAAVPPTPSVIAFIDLSHPFGTRSAWRFTATQAPPIVDPLGSSSDERPGAITLCLQKAASESCEPQLQGKLANTSDDPLFSERHYLNKAQIVRPHGQPGQPILFVVTASLHSGDGDQSVLTQAFTYESGLDRFVRVYELSTGRNNNQEVRYIDAGPLAGDIVSAEPTETAPYGFWISVNALTLASGYQPILHYRSATTYGDGNALPVIDSEMANIQRHLGLWRPGSVLPLPSTACPRPHLIRMELWCDKKD